MMARFLLLHSPLVGPRTLWPLAESLEGLGHTAAVPDLRTATEAGPQLADSIKSLAVQSLSIIRGRSPLVLAAHSGASSYLPILAPELDPDGAVLIDAGLPPLSGTFRPSADFRSELDRRVEADRHLPAWPHWWSEAQLAQLIPERELRIAISSECPRVPISFYDSAIEVPDGWARRWVGYLRLSAAYEAQAAKAAEHGWPTRRRTGGHLDTATHPDEVAAALLELIGAILTSADPDQRAS